MEKIIELSCSYSGAVNFAMQQNQIPIVHRLLLKNTSSQELHNLTLSIAFDPMFAVEWKTEIALVMPEETIELKTVDIHLSPSYLYSINEKINGSMIITVICEEEILEQQVHDISILSFDEWSGQNVIPEIIAAFITPNNSYISEIVRNASALLQKWGDNPAFTGYQRQNPNAVLKQMAAIYGALQKENISYCMPPASFEQTGQKVRLADDIKKQKLGTCLDLTLLYAACLEYIGLNPLVIFLEGHAFVGCHLGDECFPECTQDDPTMITKRFADGINEVAVVEATSLTAGKSVSFEDAMSTAKNHFADIEKFRYFVDIKRCRGSKILPLPTRHSDENGNYTFNADASLRPVSNSDITHAPEELEIINGVKQTDSIGLSRQQIWERRLLDLSLRNTLLNFRVTKNSIQLLVNSLSELEDAVANGEEFQIMNVPADFVSGIRDNKIYELRNNESMISALTSSEFKRHRIRTFLDECSLAAAIKNIYRAAKVGYEENGANTLYLALGFLKWYETDLSEKARYAPLILIPIDIIRKSAQRGYVIRMRDDEPQFNITLLEWLRTEFGITIGGLDPLPSDESGIDLKLVFHTVRQAVMGKSRWDVEELAFIGIFSFSQFIMWNDIRNRVEDLKKNKVVKSLISGRMEWEPNDDFPEPQMLDDKVSPLDMAVPISADSSQLSAIYSAGKGNTFVLHGPPGTGKSQTITNMIANALYQGKSVLFIAEKMAALSVVQRRLESVGLAPFCLELHSNKAKKKDVLDQLDETLSIGKIKNPDEYNEQAKRLHNIRSELNETVREIHKQQSYGFSLYEAIVRAEKYKAFPDCIDFTADDVHSLTPQKFSAWVDICEELEAALKLCGSVFDHALREIEVPDYSISLKAEASNVLDEYIKSAWEFGDIYELFSSSVGLSFMKSYDKIENIMSLANTLNMIDLLPDGLLDSHELSQFSDKVSEICTAGCRRDEIETELLQNFAPEIFDMNIDEADMIWRQAQNTWFIPKALNQNKVIKSIRLYANNPQSYIKSETPNIIALLLERKALNKQIEESSAVFGSLYGAVWNNGRCSWEQLEALYNQAVILQNNIVYSIDSPDMYHMVANNIKKILSQKSHYSDMMTKVISAYEKLLSVEALLSDKLRINFDEVRRSKNYIENAVSAASRWHENIDCLRDWCSYLKIRNNANSAGLSPLITALENGRIENGKVLPTFYRNISQTAAIVTVSENSALGAFNGTLFEQEIKKYKDVCKEFEQMTRCELVARLSANVPSSTSGAAGSSEIGILQRAIKSGGRGISVRKLFDSIPNLLRRLCPCMLMSPISVAQYIDPSYPQFDLVIFDEASQLPTCEAVGAIARGENLVVVGDPKQLPPTSFFTSNRIDEDNLEKEDLESVLDDCLALSIPQERLLWHYRSRHESLIAFSNRQYYENKLYTFPSPNDLVSKVRHIPVEGFYDRGKTKQNEAEAHAVVAEIVRRLHDPELRKLSIGVVTFSMVQQNLIEDLLEEEFAKSPELEEISNSVYEPIFIKNLENVQGDERDVIMFSIGYGPDKNGNVALNFGPLNRDGGWRRLNVAVSRARNEMLIFSVLRPEQINLSRTRSDGIAGLKAFLEFAMHGKSALTSRADTLHSEQGIEEIIADALRNEGLNVMTKIGASGYKVDIGILNPNKDGEFILGIICDGEHYAKSGTAYDRNILQESVLNSLGWNTVRVWCLDWWDNPKREIEKIKAAVTAALEGNTNEKETIKNTTVQTINDYERVSEDEMNSLTEYQIAVLQKVTANYSDSEVFADLSSKELIRSQILRVVEAEAPISRELLFRRILEAWGISRIGARIERTFDGILETMNLIRTVSRNRVFYWKNDMDINDFTDFRIPSNDEKTKRSIDDISTEEISAAIKYVLKTQFSMKEEDLIRETAALLGFSRCTASVQSAVSYAVAYTIQMGFAVNNGEKIVLG